jgi:hypothetical protein
MLSTGSIALFNLLQQNRIEVTQAHYLFGNGGVIGKIVPVTDEASLESGAA